MYEETFNPDDLEFPEGTDPNKIHGLVLFDEIDDFNHNDYPFPEPPKESLNTKLKRYGLHIIKIFKTKEGD